MIPPARRWRVRFIREGQTVAEVEVETVTRRFARLLARESFPVGRFWDCRLSVAPVAQTCPAAVPACNSSAYSRMR